MYYKLTFQQLINHIDKKYTNKNINHQIIFSLSKTVKNSLDLITFRNKQIDFQYQNYINKLNQYYKKYAPISNITKLVHFNNADFIVLKKVHYPRNETELLCWEIANLIKKMNKKIKIIDFCAGTGCMGISLKKNNMNSKLTLLEIDKKAICNIKKNLVLNKVEANIINNDFFKYIETCKTKFDVICFNPPYLNKNEIQENLIKYENKISFNNSNDPIEFYSELFKNLKQITNKQFIVGFEYGYNQKKQIKNILDKYKLSNYTTFYKDLNNIDRFAIIYKNSND